jgi:hypothetical protein
MSLAMSVTNSYRAHQRSARLEEWPSIDHGAPTDKRQGFSHREADEKSRLDEAIRRGMGGAGRRERSW